MHLQLLPANRQLQLQLLALRHPSSRRRLHTSNIAQQFLNLIDILLPLLTEILQHLVVQSHDLSLRNGSLQTVTLFSLMVGLFDPVEVGTDLLSVLPEDYICSW